MLHKNNIGLWRKNRDEVKPQLSAEEMMQKRKRVGIWNNYLRRPIHTHEDFNSISVSPTKVIPEAEAIPSSLQGEDKSEKKSFKLQISSEYLYVDNDEDSIIKKFFMSILGLLPAIILISFIAIGIYLEFRYGYLLSDTYRLRNVLRVLFQ